MTLHHATRLGRGLGLVAAIAALPGVARAQGVAADPEMIRPTFGHGSIHGIDIADAAEEKNTLRWGAIVQYQLNPVTGYRLEEEVGPLVGNRVVTHLGFSIDHNSRLTTRLVVPVSIHWGTHPELTDYATNGVGLGDISLGGRYLFFRSRWISIGAKLDAFFPTSPATGRRTDANGRTTAPSYMGERFVRGNAGVVALAELGPLDVGVELSVTARAVTDTRQDFELGPDLNVGYGLRLDLPGLPLDFTQQTVFRGGLTRFFRGGAENALEFLGGVQIPVGDMVRIDVSAGRGTNQGYGTTDFRALAGVIFERAPRKKVPVPIVEVPPPPPPPIIEEEVEEVWEEGELARVEEKQIVISDPIQFELNTSRILPESIPTLQAIADLLNGNALIGHVVIEGHASEEGSFEHNYTLSKSRAESIFRALLELGVHPLRLSYRGFGEIFPAATGDDEAHLQVNRRVEFHIIRQYEDWEVMPEYQTDLPLPWNGEEHEFVRPSLPDPDRTTPLEIQFERQERGEDPFQGSGFEPAPEDDFELDTPPTAPSTPPGSETPDSEETP